MLKFSKDGKTFDIAVPRRDRKKDGLSHAHKNFTIESGPQVTLEDDLGRRDFTCNSIAVRLCDGAVVDPHQGLQAIAETRITMTSPDSFSDDPLRILRAARFASVHGFTVDKAIYLKAKKVPLAELSSERIADELFRLLLESPRPSAGLQEYFRLTVLEKLFPELAALALTIQDAYFHPEQDEQGHHSVWAHTLITVDIVKKLAVSTKLDAERSLTLLLAALLHDCGKADTTGWEFKRGRMTVTSAFHDSLGSRKAEAFLSRLRIDSRQGFPMKKTILRLVQQHHRIYELYRNRDEITFKAIARAVKDMEGEDQLLLLLDFADRRSREPEALDFTDLDEIALWFGRKKEEYRISLETIQPLILGRDLIALGMAPGRQMGAQLKKLYDLQLDGVFHTRAQGLKLFKGYAKKETVHSRKGTRCRQMKLYLKNRFIEKEGPLVMGILNVTPDSFSDAGRFFEAEAAWQHAREMADAGADIIDVGGESTRPGAGQLSAEEEIDRILPIIEKIKEELNVLVSIDTSKADVARLAVEEGGADLVNDISALQFDEQMAATVAALNVPAVLMHIKGRPENMQKNPFYADVIKEIGEYFQGRIDFAFSRGIKKEKIILDPGIGFGKRLQDNIAILKNLNAFAKFDLPVLVGVSRKSFLGLLSGEKDPEKRGAETLTAALLAVHNGAAILRVHDVEPMVKALAIWKSLSA